MYLIRHLLAISSVFSIALSVTAQEPEKPLPETKVVLRVSRDFIHKLTGVNFKRDEPFGSNTNGTQVAGNARVIGQFDVKLYDNEAGSDFDLLVSGEVRTQVTATRRPVDVFTHGFAPFTAKRRIVHKDGEFVGETIEIETTHQSSLDEIRPFRGGLIGRVTRRIALPTVRRGLVDGDRQIEDEIRTQVSKIITSETDELMTVINKIGPMIKKGEELLIAEDLLPKSGLHLYRASTKDSLLFSTGLPNHRIAQIPVLHPSKHAPLELWIARRDNSKEKRLEFLLQHWELVTPIVDAQLARLYPEFAKSFEGKLYRFLNHVRIERVEDWHVVTFAPQLAETPVAGLR